MEHSSHPAIVKRLRRAEGHLRALVAMIEEGRDCLDLAQQLHAIEKAVGNAKRELIHAHISDCMDQALAKENISPADAISQLRSLTRYL